MITRVFNVHVVTNKDNVASLFLTFNILPDNCYKTL